MILSHLVAAVRRLTGRSEARSLRVLHSRGRFRRILARERSRSDRSGDRFSLLVFTPREAAKAHSAQVRLARLLRRRLRNTDEAGWMDRHSIGVVLPGTPPRGAWKVANDVCRHFAGGHEPRCKVYCYPTDPAQLDRSGSQLRREIEEGSPVEALELLFMQGMPAWKRALDLAGAAVGLILLAPLFLLVVAAIKLTSPGPVIFRQWRRGAGGRPFEMYKFRTMVAEAESMKAELLPLSEQDGPAFKITRDPRVTRLGSFLRKSSIDELPQLWNVLRGEMSLVGPRPLPCNEADGCVSWQRRRLDATPGLTCIWQVRGRSQVTFNEWVRMDLEYIQQRTLWSDMKILLATVPAVLLRRGAR